MWEDRLLTAWRQGCAVGLDIGRRQGREGAYYEMATAWNEIARPLSRSGPSFAELERRRWGPGGRKLFGKDRPGDFPGRDISGSAKVDESCQSGVETCG